MSTLTWQLYTGESLLPTRLDTKAVRDHSDFGRFLKVPTHSKHYKAVDAIAALVETLGLTTTTLLLNLNANTSLEVACEVLEDHVFQNDANPKDVQLSLMVNIIKDIVLATDIPVASRCGRAEDIIRRCQIPSDFKLALKQTLFDDKAIESYFIKVCAWNTQPVAA